MIRINVKKLEQNIDHAAALLKALSNEHRLQIICALYKGEKCVRELESITGLRQSALSQHLARLRQEELVETRRDAQTIYYSLSHKIRSEVLHTLYDICHTEEETVPA